jgi:hypothetical protein
MVSVSLVSHFFPRKQPYQEHTAPAVMEQSPIVALTSEFKQFRDESSERLSDLNQRLENADGIQETLGARLGQIEVDFIGLLNGIRADIRTSQSKFDDSFSQISVECKRIDARLRNSILRNPFLRLMPVVIYQPGRGLVEPNADLFPRNAKEFYNLKKPSTKRQKDVLVYLASFYDLVAYEDTEDTVEALEGILGLVETNFVDFQARAQQFLQRPPAKPVKRLRDVLKEGPGERVDKKVYEREASLSSEKVKLEWDHSAPQKVLFQKSESSEPVQDGPEETQKASTASESSDSEATNAMTLSRERELVARYKKGPSEPP